MNKIIGRISLYGMFIILSVSLCVNVEAASRAHNQDTVYDNSFLSHKEIANKTYTQVFDSNDWWYYNARKYNSVDSIDFNKDFWMPIEPWEYEVCSRGLSTQLEYVENAGAGSMFSGIYGDTVTVAAYKRVPERNADIDKSLLYEVSWYFHPANEGRYYTLKLVTESGESKDIILHEGAGKRNGAAGYYAIYSVTDYDKVVLMDESTPQEFRFEIVNTTDSNR